MILIGIIVLIISTFITCIYVIYSKLFVKKNCEKKLKLERITSL